MSTDWLPVDANESKSFPIQVCYTEPSWTRTCKGGVEDKQVKQTRNRAAFSTACLDCRVPTDQGNQRKF